MNKIKDTLVSKAQFIFSILVISEVIIYTFVWSNIAYWKFLSLHSYVFDLGVFLESGWLIGHGDFSIQSIFYDFLYQGIKFIVFPLSLFGNYPLVLTFQSLMIGISGFFIFLIARKRLESELASFLIASSYFIYFPMAGVNWFDFHYQMFFVPIFLLAYYFSLNEKTVLSSFLFFLSGTVRYPYAVFPALFFFLEIITQLYYRYKRDAKFQLRKFSIILFFFLISIIYIALGYILLGGQSYLLNDIGANTHITSQITTQGPPLFFNLDNKIFTVLLLLAPVVFLPLFAPKWIPFLLFPFFLIFYTNDPFYVFPELFKYQYGSGIIPFIFLGTIDSIKSLAHSLDKAPPIGFKKILQIHHGKAVKISVLILLMTVVLGSVYLPYSPLNKFTSANFNFKEYTNVNQTTYQNMMEMVKMVPANSSSVLIQNDLPQLLPRPLTPAGLMIAGAGVPLNFTFHTSSGQWVKILPDYVMANPYSNSYYNPVGYSPSPPMVQLFTELYSSGQYGILAEASGMILLERNYSGPVKLFSPLNQFYPASGFSWEPYAGYSNGEITLSNVTNGGVGWFGPYATLLPGTYNVTFYLQTDNNSPTNSITLDVAANAGTSTLSSFEINGSRLSSLNKLIPVTFSITTNNLLRQVEFRGTNTVWSGNIMFGGVSICQIQT